MKKKITGIDAKNLLKFMWRIDNGYNPTPEEERELLEIKEIDFSSLSLSALPKCLSMLTKLQSLNVNNNILSELPDCIGQLTSLQSLNVNNNILRELPDCIGQLTSLQALDVSDNALIELPDCIGQLTSLQSFDVNSNILRELPDCIAQLTSLQALDASYNNLIKLPDCIGQLTSLQALDVSDNASIELPDCIGQLTSLQSLHVNDNNLNELPDCIGQLTSLQSLHVRDNNLSELPDCIAQLTSLRSLDASCNNLSELPDCIAQLTLLKNLWLGYNKLTELPDVFEKMVNLQNLSVWKNEIIEFPYQICKLQNLRMLDISYNPIQHIPPQISNLKSLNNLDISELKLDKLPAEIMEIELPFTFNIPEWGAENGIFLKNTTLATQPISLFMQPRELIQAYFDMEQIPVNEGKVIFLGHGDVGKSYSIQRILNHDELGDFETSMTPGISISNLSVEQDDRQFNICFWDFGGQEIMHAMHRCFLTHRTCYVVMVSNRQPDMEGQARYWLRNVESFASGSDVLLVVNLWEDYPSNQDLNYNQLRTDFKNLVGCVSVSAKCDDKQTFHKLTESIIQMASKLDSVGMDFPIQWYKIRQSLTKMAKEGTYYINQDNYRQICNENELSDANIRMWLLEWFNDLGTCFSYHQDTDKMELQEYKVLNPEWLTNAIYIVILNGKNFTENGVISREGIKYLLSNPKGGTLSGVTYTSEECGYVLEVMRKFTLSYSVSETEEFIPALCPNETPIDLYPNEYVKHITYELEYTYLPDSVVHQLMIYCYQYLRLDKCWRKGMFIDIRGMDLSAVVSMGGSDKLLSIDVYAYGNSPLWLLLQPLLDAISRINNKLNLKAVDYVYAETDIDGNTFKDRYALDYILSVQKGSSKRRPYDYLQGKEVDHSISGLLANLYGEESLAAAKSEIQKGDMSVLTQSALAGATLNNCTIVFGNNNEIDVKQYKGVSEEILKRILNNQEKISEGFLNDLANIFAGHNNAEVKKLGETMQNANSDRKSVFAVLRNWLDNSEKLTSIAANLYTILPAIKIAAQKAPALANLLADLFARIPHL